MADSDIVQTIARQFHKVCAEHERSSSELMTAFVWTAVALAKWTGMSADDFLSAFNDTFRLMYANAIDIGLDSPTIIGRGGRS